MKKLFLLFILTITLLFTGITSAQSSKYGWLPQDSWSFGFGGIYPRYTSTALDVIEGIQQNLGGYVSIKRNFSEHVGLRLKLSYLHLEGKVIPSNALLTNNVIVGDFDILYYFAPSEPISPYFGFGVGLENSNKTGSPVANFNGNQLDYQLNLVFGSEWRIGTDWRIKTELGYHNVASRRFDGVWDRTGGNFGSGGLFSGNNDAYMTFDLGLLYYFKKGPVSRLNELYTGIKIDIDYDRIESMIKKYSTESTTIDYDRIEDIVKKYQSFGTGENWYLIGVNFNFNKATLRPASIPILYNATEILLSHPDLDVEIQGYTDNSGSEKYNQQLSQKRANIIRDFLIANGVAASRLTAVGYGETNPVMDNRTATGRAFNRRIEFKIR
ncbi:MAG: OmpA family protein [Bacteroidetes bacterium]|nr:OmpA family protein [Bacteroidota bacterium]